jgi:hypothetical protein
MAGPKDNAAKAGEKLAKAKAPKATPPAITPATGLTREQTDRNAEAWLSSMIELAVREPIAGLYEVTPARARAMLGQNADNRRLRPNHVARLRNDIAEGRWQVNGEALIFAYDGTLNDGQHRLHAVIEANRAISTVLVFGVTRASRFTLDLGVMRRPEDVLHFMGHHYTASLASAARLVIAWERGRGKNLNWLRNASSTLIVERAHADEALQEAVRWAGTKAHLTRNIIPASPLAMVRYLIMQVNPEQAEEYLRGLVEGTNLKSGSPALSVRRYLYAVDNRAREAIIAFMLRGWSLFMQGREAEAGELHGRMPLPGIGLEPPEE